MNFPFKTIGYNAIIVCFYRQRFNFSFQVSFSETYQNNLVYHLTSLSIEVSIQLFYSHFYFLVFNQLIGLVDRVFTNVPGHVGSISSRLIPKTLKTVFVTSLLNTQQYKVYIKGILELSRKRISTLPYTSE